MAMARPANSMQIRTPIRTKQSCTHITMHHPNSSWVDSTHSWRRANRERMLQLSPNQLSYKAIESARTRFPDTSAATLRRHMAIMALALKCRAPAHAIGGCTIAINHCAAEPTATRRHRGCRPRAMHAPEAAWRCCERRQTKKHEEV